MEVAVAKALKPSLRTEFNLAQAISDEILCLNANNVIVGEEFSVDDLLDFSNGEILHGKEINGYEEEEDEEKDSISGSSQSQDDNNSNSTSFSVAGDSDSIFAGELAVPADDVADLEWVSHFVDDSLPELSLLYPVRLEEKRAWAKPELKPGTVKTLFHPSAIPRRPRTTKTRKPISHVWSFTATLSLPSSVFPSSAQPLVFSGLVKDKEFVEPPVKKPKKKPEAQTGGPQFQRRCSHCQVQKTPQWRTGPLGAKTLCNACGVRFKSGRLFPEYRPASSPTFSGDIHSNSHRKVLEIRRRKEMFEPTESSAGSDQTHTQMVPSC